MSDRIIKINERIHSIMGELLEREISLKQGALATIVRVDTAPNLRSTKVFISAFPESETLYVLKTLEHEQRPLEIKLHQKLATRPLPKLLFELDTTNQAIDEIEKILKHIHEE
ncbi:MAG: ribosome-binding factor A [Candidatus Moraniibacteriota bacterium]|nr:MAG: ribosome-binding factor A [Candidatus Moranbacteria bacterium]